MAAEARPPIGERIKYKLLQFGRLNAGALRRRLHAPAFPVAPDGKLLLHVGCGMVNAPGFVNIDLLEAPHVHVVRPIDDLSVFPDACADMVYACHCLEHFGFRRTRDLLEEWVRVLRPGGLLRLAVPDFSVIARAYASGASLRELQSLLLGGQDYRLNFHAAVFDEALLSEAMTGVGIANIQRWDARTTDHHDFTDESAITCPMGDGERVLLSLNLEGRKR
jgi:SAM-dependent methyltransferase